MRTHIRGKGAHGTNGTSWNQTNKLTLQPIDRKALRANCTYKHKTPTILVSYRKWYMSLLAALLAEEKIISPREIPPPEKINFTSIPTCDVLEDLFSPVTSPPSTATTTTTTTTLARIPPCPKCSFPLLWISVYDPETLHCRECSPPPGPRMVARFANAGDLRELDQLAGQQSSQENSRPRIAGIDPHEPPSWKSPLIPLHRWQRIAIYEAATERRERDREAGRLPGQPAARTRANAPGELGATPQHKEPNPGGFRDWRNSGRGACVHPTATWLDGPAIEGRIRVICNLCGGTVGHKPDKPVGVPGVVAASKSAPF